MITRLDIEERVREWGLREDMVEKDYVIGWVLWGIGAEEKFATDWAFKGGTSLKKCYLDSNTRIADISSGSHPVHQGFQPTIPPGIPC